MIDTTVTVSTLTFEDMCFRITDLESKLAECEARLEKAVEALSAIDQYGSDTLSGRADGPDDRSWQREGVLEMTRRARSALKEIKGQNDE